MPTPRTAVAAQSPIPVTGAATSAGISAVAPSAKMAKNGPADLSRHRSASTDAATANTVSTPTSTAGEDPRCDSATPTLTPTVNNAAARACCRVRARPLSARPYMPANDPKTA